MDRCRFSLLFSLLCLGLGLSSAVADRIVLKDGTVEESDRVWESKDYVHFILRGTQTVEIRYAKALVERIEGKHAVKTPPAVGSEAGTPSKPSADAVEAAPAIRMSEADRRRMDGMRGIVFYDPRRPKRYWAGTDSQHATLEGAIDALAKQYGQSPQWVLAHIGEENDLALIHEKLYLGDHKPSGEPSRDGATQSPKAPRAAAPKEKDTVTADAATVDSAGKAAEGVQFYDPRRPEKYWISPDRRFRTMGEAVNALAGSYRMSAEWVETHMGGSNELSEIHRNLETALSKTGTGKK